MKKDDEIILKYLIKAIAELNENYNGALSVLKDDYKEAGLNPLLDAISHLMFHPHDLDGWHCHYTMNAVWLEWGDSTKVDIYFNDLIERSDAIKRKLAEKSIEKGIKSGELLLLDFRMEML